MLIREGVKKAMGRIKEFKPLKISPPFELKIEYKLESSAESESKRPDIIRIDPRTILRKSDNMFDII